MQNNRLQPRKLFPIAGFILGILSGIPCLWLTPGMSVARGNDNGLLKSNATAEEIKGFLSNDLTYLSSDELAGRGVGSDGIIKAGEYIARRFADLGLKTDSFDGTPFQNFTIPGPIKLGSLEQNRLTIQGGKLEAPLKLEIGKEFNTLSLGSNGAFRGQLAFAGYGISADELGYDDYAGWDAKGKVVIALRKEPQQELADSKFNGTQNSQYAFFTAKELNAATHGVAALILVNDFVTVKAATTKARTDLENAEKQLAELMRTPKPEQAAEQESLAAKIRGQQAQVDALKLKLASGEIDPVLGVSEGGNAVTDKKVPTFFVTRAVADKLLQAGLGKSLSEMEQVIESTGKSNSAVLQDITVEGEALTETSAVPVRNVIGVLPGSGSLAEEYVVVGAHYDHVGMGGMGSLAPGTIAVHNGADDNGSGTVTMLEVARQLASLKSDSRRSIIFMAFSAEESGLLGSQYYARHPRWAIEKTVTMVNMDMVGRLHNNELTVYGTGTAKGFAEQVDRLGNTHKFRVVKVPQGRGASDHASFYDVKVPVFHFFTGLHNDYHRPSDDFVHINVDGMVRISQMVSDLVSEIAQAPNKPELLLIEGSARPRTQSSTTGPMRAILGVRLETDANAPAVLVAVTEGGPASKAGLKPGDRIVALGDTAISTATELRAALAKLRTGSKVTATLIRDNQELKLEIDLSE